MTFDEIRDQIWSNRDKLFGLDTIEYLEIRETPQCYVATAYSRKPDDSGEPIEVDRFKFRYDTKNDIIVKGNLENEISV